MKVTLKALVWGFYISEVHSECLEMNRTGFNSYNSILIIVNKLIVRLYTAMIRQIIMVQTKF